MSVKPYDMPSDEDLDDVLQDYADLDPHFESDYPYRAALMRHAGSVVARLRAELERVTAERDELRALWHAATQEKR